MGRFSLLRIDGLKIAEGRCTRRLARAGVLESRALLSVQNDREYLGKEREMKIAI
jgi:hypothetical protein